MDILITPQSENPIYRQIEDSIRAQILNRKLKEDSPLPSIRQLAVDLHVSVITVKSAYEELEGDGFIYSFPGKGFYVSPMSEKQVSLIRRKIAEESITKQITYLKSLGISEEEIRTILNEKNNEL